MTTQTKIIIGLAALFLLIVGRGMWLERMNGVPNSVRRAADRQMESGKIVDSLAKGY